MGKKGGVVTIAWYLQRGAKNSSMFEFPRLLPTHYSRAADAQPISPDVTCVTELNNIFFCSTLYIKVCSGPKLCKPSKKLN